MALRFIVRAYCHRQLNRAKIAKGFTQFCDEGQSDGMQGFPRQLWVRVTMAVALAADRCRMHSTRQNHPVRAYVSGHVIANHFSACAGMQVLAGMDP